MSDIYEMLDRHEGDRLKPYLCPAGKRTIGRGWNIDANPLPDDIEDYLDRKGEITQEMSDRLLKMSVANATRYCFRLFPDFLNFTDNRRNALIDFLFNVGIGTASKFVNTIAAINRGDWSAAADGLMKSAWFKQVGNRGPEIVALVREG